MTPIARRVPRFNASPRRRSGLSLLEVILALAILATALVMLSNLLDIGIQSAGDARKLTRAQILCETKLAELTSGIVPLESVQMAPFEYDPEWVYSVLIESTEEEGLVQVHVTVQRAGRTGRGAAAFSLTRWVVDPGLDLSEPPEEEEEEEAETENETSEEPAEGAGGFNG